MPAGRTELYFIDGTNLVRGAWAGHPQAREQEEGESRRLVEILSGICAEAGGGLEVEVYFDGPGLGWRGGASNLRVRASHEETADDLILDRVRAWKFLGGTRVVVVTADGELGREAEREGAKWLNPGLGGGYERVIRQIEARFLR